MRREEVEHTFERYGPMVFRRARAILGNEEEARDVMQDVFIKILSGGMKSDGPVSGWLNRVTTNECISRVREKKRRTALLDTNLFHDAPEDRGAEDRVAVRALLGEIEERTASAAICVHIDGMTHEETSKHLGVSVRTVANLLTRFKERSLELLGHPRDTP